VLTDDLAWNLVRYMPHVQQMRRQGMTFTRYFVTDSLCCPSRSSIFTGMFPHDTGVFTNNGPDGGYGVFHARHEERRTFAYSLHASGYRTALMGKYLNGYEPASSEGGRVPPGWDEWDVAGNGYPEFGYTLNQDGRLVHYGHRPRAYLTDVLARRGVRFVDHAAAQRRPFLLELATFAPHGPYVPAPRDARSFPGLRAPRDPAFGVANVAPPAWLANYAPLTRPQVRAIDRDFRRRVQSVQAVDRMIGRVEAELRRRGLARNTYIVFSSDNGLHMGEHRLLPGKLTAFDTDIRVPLIVIGPGVPHGRQVDKLAQNTDLAPTFLELAGRPVPPAIDGRSLVPLLRGRTVRGWRHAVLIEHRGPEVTPGDPDLPVQGAGNPTAYEAVRTGTRLYVGYADGERELYDLRSDPWEIDNLAGQASASASGPLALARTLSAMQSCHTGAACWRAAGGAG
jgi:arylsulfatase A-like enzyme